MWLVFHGLGRATKTAAAAAGGVDRACCQFHAGRRNTLSSRYDVLLLLAVPSVVFVSRALQKDRRVLARTVSAELVCAELDRSQTRLFSRGAVNVHFHNAIAEIASQDASGSCSRWDGGSFDLRQVEDGCHDGQHRWLDYRIHLWRNKHHQVRARTQRHDANTGTVHGRLRSNIWILHGHRDDDTDRLLADPPGSLQGSTHA